MPSARPGFCGSPGARRRRRPPVRLAGLLLMLAAVAALLALSQAPRVLAAAGDATGQPSISGVAQAGETLTASTSDIADGDGLTNVEFRYQWIRNDGNADAEIQGATESTHELSNADAGKTVKVRVSFTDDADYEETLTSEPTGAVAARPNRPATGLPTISGTARVKETLTADVSGIADPDGMDSATFSYQWIRHDGTRFGVLQIIEIEDAKESTYTLRPADVGRVEPADLVVRVSFNDDAGNHEVLTSATFFGPIFPAPPEECPGGGYNPAPVEVAVEAVPIVVESTAEEYFVLYVVGLPPVNAYLDSSPSEVPVSVTLGEEATTALTDRLSALPKERYRVEKYLIADPADVDGDCIDDITELEDPVGMNPVNPAPAVPFVDGVVAIPDRETFETLIAGPRVNDPHLQDLAILIFGHKTDRPAVYFGNTEEHLGFIYRNQLRANPLYWEGRLFGELVYHPDVLAPNGYLGVYAYSFEPNRVPNFATVALAHELLAASLPLLDNNLAYRPIWPRQREEYDLERTRYDDSRVNVLLEEDILRDVDFIPFNREEGYGFLRVMSLEERPNPRDIVIYEALPNELSRVAGIITTVPQTPLAHVNLRAVQDGVPNAYVRGALDDDGDIAGLIGAFVHYTVTDDGYSIRAATSAEVDAHYAASRPAQTQTPERDLTVTQVTALDGIGFDDWNAFGVKAANVAVLRTLGFPDGTVPDGFAVPFYFYDEFMKHNGFYEDIEAMLADPDFQSDFDVQEAELKKLRKKIKKGESPQWMIDALTAMHATFPEGQSLRYRSSTNNEDLPGFSGAGLYDSKTQKPDETVEDGIDKSLKQVYASMWNFRAFTEREFHRIDHLAAAMGVLVHPNFSDELANGVAVSLNPIVGGVEGYYVNTQLGEDLVTNPEALSVPEEVLLHEPGKYARNYEILTTSNRVDPGELLMSDAQMDQLRGHLGVIHDEFAELYGIEAGEKFAMEIEFKITSENVLSIKQARPWVFSHVEENSQATGKPAIGGTAEVDETLTAETSGIADPNGLNNAVFRYQWIRSDGNADTEIQGATESTHELSNADAEKTIKVRVSFTDDAEYEETLTSAATAAVAAKPNIAATGLPAIGGTDRVKETLTADVSGIADPDGLDNVTFSYQWIRGDGHTDTDIQNATGSTYTLEAEDEGKTVKVRVSFTDDAGNQESLTSAATASVAPVSPVVWSADMSVVDLGNGTIGAVSSDLFSNVGGSAGLQAKWLWHYAPGRHLRLAFTDVVPGAEELTLQIGDAALTFQAGDSAFTWNDVDVDWEDGQIIPVRIVPTSATAVPQPNSPATGLPAITGTAQVDETLTASTSDIADADGLITVSYSYRWIRSDGNTDTDIKHATGSTYELSDADEGKTIKVQVTFTDDADNEESLTSAATEAVAARPNSPATGLPTISGTAQVEETLTVDTSAIADSDGLTNVSYRYQWSRGDGNADTDIEDAAVSTYTLATTDEGKTIQVRVSFTDDADNEESLTSAATAVVEAKPNSAPTGLPTISGTAQVGQELTADTSGIADEDALNDAVFAYQWLADDANIQGAANSTYTLSDEEVGKAIKVKVSFTDDGSNDETLTSAATAVVAAKPNSPATGAPTISGTAQVDQTMTADTSRIADEDGLTDVSYSYQWIRSDGGTDTDLVGETNATYTLVSADQGKTIKVRVSFTDDGGNEETLTSTATAEIAARPNTPATGAPVISGTAQVGETLTAETTGIADEDGLTNVSYRYQWLAGGTDIDGATGSSHTLTDDAQGKAIRVRVTFTDDVGNQEVLTSTATTAVAAKPNTPATGEPDITGTAQVGEVLTVDTSNIADQDGLDDVSYSYQWLAAGANIDGATFSSYTLTASQQGQTIKVRVSFTDDGSNDETLTSAATAVVAAKPNSPATGAPVITGTAQRDETLTADTSGIADADGLTTVSYSYQWIRNDGNTDADIAGETASAYTLSDEDVGKSIKVRVSFADDAHNEESTSAATVVAKPNTAPTGLPTISGTAQVGETLTADTSGIADDDGLNDAVFAYQWLADDANIQGAANSTYILSDEDVGKAIKVKVSFTDDGSNDETLTSAATAVVAAKPNSPATGAPTISGTAQVDQTMTADTSRIADEDGLDDVSYSYQWIRSDGGTDTDLVGETNATYTLVSADQGKTIKVRATFTDDADIQESLTSAATATVVAKPNTAPTGLPTISGTAQVGETLTADTSDIADDDGLTDPTFTYQWVAGGTDISGATSSTYFLTSSEQAQTIQVQVSFTDDADNQERLTSKATAAVAPRSYGTVWLADMLVVEYTEISIGAASADLFSNIGGSGNLQIKSLWSYTPDRDLRLSFKDGVPDAADYTLQVGGLTLEFPKGSSGNSSFKWTDVDVDWEDGKTIAVRIVLTSTLVEPTPNTPATGLPTISGTAQVDETLTADTSGIADEDGLTSVSYSYQWIRSDGNADTDIAGETASTYTLVSTDEGKTIKVRVSFTDAANNEETLISAATVEVAAKPNSPATGAPTIGGTAQVGEMLTAEATSIADEDGLTNVSYSYQWIADGTDIDGATGSTYELSNSQEGKTIQVRVSFTDDANNEETLISAATTAVAAAPNREATGKPTIGGTAQVDETLTADTSPIADQDGLTNVSYSYQWIAGGSDIDGATGSSYELTSSEQGQTIQVRVTFTDDRNNAEARTSDATAAVAAKPNSPATGLPAISGTPQVGKTLTASTSGIADEDGLDDVSYRYQWIAGESDIDGATGSSYELTSSEQGQTIQVRVTFTDDRNNAEARTSDATAAVAAKPNSPATGLPAISGTPQVGKTLTASTSGIADEDGLDDVSYRYQWIAGESDIDGATGSSYELTSSEQGQTIQVRVTFTDDRNNAETLTSIATAEVTAAPVPLTVSVTVSAPASHDGSSEFTFEIEFSEEFGISYKTLRDHSFNVTGGEVRKAQRTNKPSNISWRITVQPQGTGDVTIQLPVTTDCNADGAICTADGRKLSNSLTFTVSGPGG